MNTYNLRDGIYKALSGVALELETAAGMMGRIRLELDDKCKRIERQMRELQRLEADVVKPRLERLRALARAVKGLGVVLTLSDLQAMRPEVRLAVTEMGRALQELKEGDADVPTAIVAG